MQKRINHKMTDEYLSKFELLKRLVPKHRHKSGGVYITCKLRTNESLQPICHDFQLIHELERFYIFTDTNFSNS